MLTLDPVSLSHFQSCHRRWLLERAWRAIRPRPKTLFDACLREGVLNLSNQVDRNTVVAEARARFLGAAANPGLELAEGADSYQVASDWAAMLATVLTAIARLTLLVMRKASTKRLTEDVMWQPLSLEDDSGQLHRWATVSVWNNDAISHELHSWYVMGDMCVLGQPMQLHIVEIGQQRAGRRASPWARVYKSGTFGKYRFERPKQGDWRRLYFADQGQTDEQAWVNLMEEEGVSAKLMHHPLVALPSDTIVEATRQDILREAQAMLRLEHEPAMSEPMSRVACDGLVPCPWQAACFREHPAEGIDRLGLYQARSATSPPMIGPDSRLHQLLVPEDKWKDA